MDEIIELLDEYLRQTDQVIEYVNQLTGEEREYYRKHQEILYVGIVNRTYSLWETFCKDLVYKYYLQIKEELLSRGELVKKLRLNELPGYIVETGRIQDEAILYDLKKDFITYTTKNIGSAELKNLFDRFGVEVGSLKSTHSIKEHLKDNNEYFDISDFRQDFLKIAMSKLTEERNKVSHSSSIVEYQRLEDIRGWAVFFQLLSKELTMIVCKKIIDNNRDALNNVGKYQKFYNGPQVLCIDIGNNVQIDKKTLLVIKRSDNIIALLKPESFEVNDIDKESVVANDPAGIKFKALFSDRISDIRETDQIEYLSNVFL